MFIAAASYIKSEGKPRILGVADTDKAATIVVLNQRGEVVAEAKTLNPGKYAEHKQQNPKWLVTHTEAQPEHGHILINLETLEMWEEISMPLHLALETPTPTRPPLFKDGYKEFRRFGEFYGKPLEEIRELLEPIIAVAGEAYAEKAKISGDEKTLCVNAKGETRIYSLDTLELEEIITWDEIIWALRRAGTPRKMMRMALQSDFVGLIDPDKPSLVWYVIRWPLGYPEIPIGIFIYDRQEREIIAGPKNPLEIIRKAGVDEEYRAAMHVDEKWLYDPDFLEMTRPNYVVEGHIQGTYPGAAVFTLSVFLNKVVSESKEKRAELGLPSTFLWTLLFRLNEDLELESYLCKIPYKDGYVVPRNNDHGGNERICGFENDVVMQCDFEPLDPYGFNFFYGVVRLSPDLRILNMFESDRLEEWFVDEYGLRERLDIELPSGRVERRYRIFASESTACLSPDRSEVLVPLELNTSYYAEVFGGERIHRLYLFRVDWGVSRVREIKMWEGDSEFSVWWTAWV